MSETLTKAYSTSFSLGIMAFAKEFRGPIYSIYGFVRLADEIVDTFHDYDKEYLLNKLEEDLKEALSTGISANAVLHSFQQTAREYNIEWDLIESFLKSMRMDLNQSYYKRGKYDEYIFGSAEAVGLMCLKVFCKGDNKEYKKLAFNAKMLGSAFQKVNFLRDIKSDLEERERIYLPDVNEENLINNYHKTLLEKEIEREFSLALEGILRLPNGVKLGVYSAYLYYYILFGKIKAVDIEELKSGRIRVSNFRKIILLLESIITIRILRLI